MCIHVKICDAVRNLQNLLLLIFLHQFLGAEGQKNKVEIHYPYHPLYVQESTTLKLTCNTTRRQVEWVRSSTLSQWKDQTVKPEAANGSNTGFRIELWTEEPSGNVSSSLFKNDLQVWDRGTYTCRTPQKDLQYSVWVTVIRIISTFVVMKEAGQLRLECNITGFNNNLPDMKYDWYYNNSVVRVKPSSTDSGEKIKYAESTIGRNSRLTVYHLSKESAGVYECEFSLPTSIGFVVFSDKIIVPAKDIPQLSEGSITEPNSTVTLLLFVILSTCF